jgi:hypothetical protein
MTPIFRDRIRRVFADAAVAVFKAGRTRYFFFLMFHENAIGASTTRVG